MLLFTYFQQLKSVDAEVSGDTIADNVKVDMGYASSAY